MMSAVVALLGSGVKSEMNESTAGIGAINSREKTCPARGQLFLHLHQGAIFYIQGHAVMNFFL